MLLYVSYGWVLFFVLLCSVLDVVIFVLSVMRVVGGVPLKKALLQCLQLLRGGIWAMGMYDVPLSMSLLGFGTGTMLAKFHMCGVKSSFQHAQEECEAKRAYVF